MLYYLWDAAHVMTAYPAIIFGKAPLPPSDLSPSSRLEPHHLTTAPQIPQNAARLADDPLHHRDPLRRRRRSIAAPRSLDPGAADNSLTQSALHIQAKCLRSIVARGQLRHSHSHNDCPPKHLHRAARRGLQRHYAPPHGRTTGVAWTMRARALRGGGCG